MVKLSIRLTFHHCIIIVALKEYSILIDFFVQKYFSGQYLQSPSSPPVKPTKERIRTKNSNMDGAVWSGCMEHLVAFLLICLLI